MLPLIDSRSHFKGLNKITGNITKKELNSSIEGHDASQFAAHAALQQKYRGKLGYLRNNLTSTGSAHTIATEN